MTSPRVNLDDDGTLDDFMARDVAMVHFEALDDSQWYATIQLADGEVWQLNFGATNPRAKGYARAESIGTFPIQNPRVNDMTDSRFSLTPPWWFCCGWWSPWCLLDTVFHELHIEWGWVCEKHDAAITGGRRSL